MKLGRYNQLADRQDGRPQYRAAIVTVPGVRTTGGWQKALGPIAADRAIRVEHVDIGWVNPLFRARRRALDGIGDLMTKVRAHRSALKGTETKVPISIIGHSFGTLIACWGLLQYPDLRVERLILSSSILRLDFPWADLFRRNQCRAVLNEYCPGDRAVLWAPALRLYGLPTGHSGRVGFSFPDQQRVKNVAYNDVGHTSLPNPLRMEDAWLPFVLDGTIPPH